MTKKRLILGTAPILAYLLGSSAASAQCYVDSNSGNDSNDGLSETSPVQSQAAIPSDCTEVRYACGSTFNEPVDVGSNFGGGGGRTVFTNYGDKSLGLPRFVVESGSVVSSFGGGITVDGLYLAGSTGDGTMQGLMAGVCVSMAGDSRLLNSEIADCDIGIMLRGEGSLIQGNLIRDLKMAVDSTNTDIYANAVGGAEGIFINGANNEVAYNTFLRCADAADWVSGNCDGGATEVTVGEGDVVDNLRIHHNVAIDTCGFFEVSGFGTFSNSEFHHNVMIDSGWMMLLQVNETTLDRITWTNNTAIHHATPNNPTISPSVTMIYRAEVTPGTVLMMNNLIVFESPNSFMATIDGNIEQSSNLLLTGVDPGFLNMAGHEPADFDLAPGSQAIDAGEATPYTTDFLNRAVPAGAAPDIGAFEHGAEEGSAGGASVPSAGGSPPATGGAEGEPGTGGAPAESGLGGAEAQPAQGGAAAQPATGGAAAQPAQGGAETQPAQGGAETQSAQGGAEAQPAQGGAAAQSAQGGAEAQPTTADSAATPSEERAGCGCTVIGSAERAGLARGAWLALLALALFRIRSRRHGA